MYVFRTICFHILCIVDGSEDICENVSAEARKKLSLWEHCHRKENERAEGCNRNPLSHPA